MRFRNLNFEAFGPFSGTTLDFGDMSRLHIVHGPNEAGKSSALRAIHDFLFGIPMRTQDDFLHPYKDMRISGSLDLEDGRVITATRYKRNKNDLVDGSNAPILPQTWSGYMGGVGSEIFRSMFGIDHESLRSGSENLLKAEGSLGQTLFAAASGVGDLRAVLERISEMEGELFKKRGSGTAIQSRLSRLGELRKALKECSASHKDWKALRQTLEDLRQRRSGVQGKLDSYSLEIARLERILNAYEPMAKRKVALAMLSSLEDVPELPAGFTEARAKAQSGIEMARQRHKEAESLHASLSARLEAISIDEDLLQVAETVERLSGLASVNAKAMADSAELRIQRDSKRLAAEGQLRELGFSCDLSEAEKLLPPKPVQQRILDLGKRYAALQSELRSATEAGEDAREKLRKLTGKLDETKKPVDATALAATLKRAVEAGDLQGKAARSAADIAGRRANLGRSVSALGLWKGDLADLESLALPVSETLERFERRFTDIGKSFDAVRLELDKTLELRRKKQRELEILAKQGELATEKDLSSIRHLRDQGWALIKAEWLQDGAEPNDIQLFLDASQGHFDLAESYEAAVSKADDISDILRKDESRLGQAAALRAEVESLESELASHETRLQHTSEAHDELLREWRAVWHPLSIEPLTPQEMRSWLSKAREICRELEDLRKAEAEAATDRAVMEDLYHELISCLTVLGEPAPGDLHYGQLVQHAGRVRDEAEELRRTRNDLERIIKEQREVLERSTTLNARVEHDLAAWKEEWLTATALLATDADHQPIEIEQLLLDLADVTKRQVEIRQYETRISAISRDYAEFSSEVAVLVARVAPDLAAAKAEDAVMALATRLRKESEKKTLRERLAAEIQEAVEKAKAAILAVQRYEEDLVHLCVQAGTKDPAELPTIDEKAANKARLLAELRGYEEQIAILGAGQDRIEFLEQAATLSPDEVQVRRERLWEEKRDAESERDRLSDEIGAHKERLEHIDGSDKAAEKAEEIQGVIGELQFAVERLVRMRLARLIIDREIERYREANQGPVLCRASELFAAMTRNSFSGVRADFDNTTGEPVLKAERSGGELLGIKVLSDGSRDQLYLSLRLSGLHRYLDGGTAMPFIVDDIQVHFDDDRSAAALKSLAELAGRTQVIFFTHHRHLLDIARSSLPEHIVAIHELRTS